MTTGCTHKEKEMTEVIPSKDQVRNVIREAMEGLGFSEQNRRDLLAYADRELIAFGAWRYNNCDCPITALGLREHPDAKEFTKRYDAAMAKFIGSGGATTLKPGDKERPLIATGYGGEVPAGMSR